VPVGAPAASAGQISEVMIGYRFKRTAIPHRATGKSEGRRAADAIREVGAGWR